MGSGHPNAAAYPLSLLYEEARLVTERQNREEATRAILLQGAVSSMLSKEGGSNFQKMIEDLLSGQQ